MAALPSPDSLEAIVQRFSGPSVLVLGDPVLDVYLYGSTHRISREAPVLIVKEDDNEARLGGAANAAANLAKLGASTRLVGLVGNDEGADALERLCEAAGIEPMLARSDTFRTVTKTRILAGALHTRRQQMLRIDRGPSAHYDPQADWEDLEANAIQALADADAMILSEYAEGWELTDLYTSLAERARAEGKVVVADSRGAIDRYHGITAVTPNEPEMAKVSFRDDLTDETTAIEAARHLRERLQTEAVLLTRGREGMAIALADGRVYLLEAHGGHEAIDVTGAGDTVVATFTLALSAGADVLHAAVLANCAASLSVRETGAATVDPVDLAREARAYQPHSLRPLEPGP